MSCIDKAANNIAFIYEKYVQVLLKEEGLLNTTWNTYQQVNDTLLKVLQQENNSLDSVFGLKDNTEEFNRLPCVYWLPKMDKIAVNKFINKPLSKHVISAFKLCYSQIDAYHKKKNILVGLKPFG